MKPNLRESFSRVSAVLAAGSGVGAGGGVVGSAGGVSVVGGVSAGEVVVGGMAAGVSVSAEGSALSLQEAKTNAVRESRMVLRVMVELLVATGTADKRVAYHRHAIGIPRRMISVHADLLVVGEV